jgi:anti-sigma factor RsiW
MSFTCADKDTLIAFLYEECDEATRGAVTAHVATCPACADEVRGFAHVRETLSRWAPPDRVGGFRLVRDEAADAPATATVLRPARWWQAPVPILARVAAAILLFAGGAALANLDVRYDKNGFAVRTGWRAPVVAPGVAGQAAAADPQSNVQSTPASYAASSTGQADSPWRMEMAALERSLRDEFHQQLAAARASGSGGPGVMSASADLGEARLMSQVHALIDDNYRRQQIEMAYQIRQVERELQTSRKSDVIRASQPFGQLDGPPIYSPEQRQMSPYIRLNPVTLKK